MLKIFLKSCILLFQTFSLFKITAAYYVDGKCVRHANTTDGIFKARTMQINEDMLKEYFSEGYRAFYQEPSALKEKDPQLYHFIEGLKDDKK